LTSIIIFATLKELIEIRKRENKKMRRIATLSLVLSLVFVTSCFGQTPVNPTVPDLTSKNWKFEGESGVLVSVQTNNQQADLQTSAKFYYNDTEKMYANTLLWRGSEVAMVFGASDADRRFAIKVNGKWHVAKDKNKSPVFMAVYDSTGKPTGVKMTLDTFDGPKELTLDLN